MFVVARESVAFHPKCGSVENMFSSCFVCMGAMRHDFRGGYVVVRRDSRL